MAPTEIVTLSLYALGPILYVIILFIQKAQIEKMKTTTDQFEKFMRIFDLNKVEDYVRMNEKNLEIKKENWIQEYGKTVVDKLVKENVTPSLEKHLGDFKKSINDQMNELGYFVVDFLSAINLVDREKLFNEWFPKTAQLLRVQIEAKEKWEREHPDDDGEQS